MDPGGIAVTVTALASFFRPEDNVHLLDTVFIYSLNLVCGPFFAVFQL